MEKPVKSDLSFFARVGAALSCFGRALGSSEFCRQVAALPESPRVGAKPAPTPEAKTEAKPKPAEPPPERVHASGLAVLSLLQREGRLVDFLQEDMGAFSDAEIGAAARVVHAGCRKALSDHFGIEPALKESEGASINVPPGFDAQRIRLTGNVAGQPPFRGALKHHGWVVTSVRMPAVSGALDPRVIAAAEVEL
jgi:hypothetical protein